MEFYSEYNEWNDVVNLIPNRSGNSSPTKVQKIEGLTFESFKFIPPVVQDFIALSINEEKSKEFEKSTNQIFQMLGFDVIDYGQGTGRNPDG